ncbi:MAG TPA: cytochrome c oxidase assembly protein [Candidatus Acidoferrales bacterium]|nr:cytochrome c oxidase assembly protein [Candidatus Acidoferrales bacterium]
MIGKPRPKSAAVLAAALLVLVLPAAYLYTADRSSEPRAPFAVADRYLRAIYARDYAEAYRYISAADRKIKNAERYARERGQFGGFALEAARKLATYIELAPAKTRMAGDRATLTVKAKLPDANALAPLFLSWDPYRLNSLPASRQRELMAALEKMKRDGTLKTIEGEQTLDLVRENGAWKVFLDWAAGVRVRFRTAVPPAAQLDATLPQNEVIAHAGEAFNVVLEIRNRGARAQLARIGHVIEPKELSDYLDLVECGFLLPVELSPGKKETYTSTYLLRGSLPDGAREIVVTYDFKLD